MDRVSIDYKGRAITAIANIAESEKTIPKGCVGLFEVCPGSYRFY